jgi:hypothetical protein
MAKRFALLIPLLLLNLGCLPVDPLVPELKGRWASDNIARVRHALLTYPPPAAPEAISDPGCRAQYVTFGKQFIAMHTQDMVPLFAVREFKRDGNRLTLTGSASVPGGTTMQIDLLLRNGEVRFDDVRDQKGRSVAYERLEHEQARQAGVKTIGDVFRLVLDTKPCRA